MISLQHSDLLFLRFEPRFQADIIALHRSAIEGFNIGIDTREEEKDLHSIFSYYLQSDGEFLVGLLQDSVVSMGGFLRLAPDRAELKRMRIRRDLQGQGIGSRVLFELENRARAVGIREMTLETAKRRPLTLAFYRKHGYQESGHSYCGSVETLKFSKILKESPP